jgi:hypothetical protein
MDFLSLKGAVGGPAAPNAFSIMRSKTKNKSLLLIRRLTTARADVAVGERGLNQQRSDRHSNSKWGFRRAVSRCF